MQYIIKFIRTLRNNLGDIQWLNNIKARIKKIPIIRDFFICVISLFNPIKKHRFLYGNRWGWIYFSTFVTGIIIFGIWLISKVFNISGNDLIYNIGIDRHKLIYGIVSQFLDPGNIIQTTDKGVLFALLCTFAGIICLSGLFVSSCVNAISIKSEKWKEGYIHYGIWTRKLILLEDYIVIIGVNEQTGTIIKKALQDNTCNYVLIQSNKNIKEVRQKLYLELDETEEEKVIFYHGDRTSAEDINALHIEEAKEVYVLGEDMQSENEQDHDAFNMTCLKLIANDAAKNYCKSRIKCHVNFEYQSTFMAFKFTHIYKDYNSIIEFLPFNIHEIWARKVLVDNLAIIQNGKHTEKQIFRYLPLETYKLQGKKCIINEDTDVAIHFVIIGMNQMGVALAMQAALLEHLPNFHSKVSKPRTTITFIDNNAIKEAHYLMGRYSALFELCRFRVIDTKQYVFEKHNMHTNADQDDIMWHLRISNRDKSTDLCEWNDPMENEDSRFSYLGENFMDLQWEFIEGDIASTSIREYLSAITSDKEHRTCTIAVCFNNPQVSIATALYLPKQVLRQALQIWVYQQNSFDMVQKIATSEKEWKRYSKLRPFGMIAGCYEGGRFDDLLAQFTNLVFSDSKLKKDCTFSEELRLKAAKLWKDLGIVDRYANLDFVDSIGLKQRILNTPYIHGNQESKDKRLNFLSEAEHMRWVTERLTMGYRPLELEEFRDYKDQNLPTCTKDFYKEKSRAHIDISSSLHIKQWDRTTFLRNTDRRLIEMIPTMQLWLYQCIVDDNTIPLKKKRSIIPSVDDTYHQLLLSKKRNMIATYINDMCYIRHTSSKRSFWISKNLVTIMQWEEVMESLPIELTGENIKNPIRHISWNQIQDFLCILKNETGLPFDLPSKEDWYDAFENDKDSNNLIDMEGNVWQWTRTNSGEYKSSYIFCGRSQKFMESNWGIDGEKIQRESYWLPDFRSEDLGFRLTLPFSFAKEAINKDNSQTIDENRKIVGELIQSFVFINSEGSDLTPFYISQNPITQRQWQAIISLYKEKYKILDDLLKDKPSAHIGDYYPVEMVSYNDIQIFFNYFMKLFGIKIGLPSQQQWLYAAEHYRATNDTIWHSGIAKTTHKISPSSERDKVYNMYGNVWEWCSDLYKEHNICHVMMGGSWRFTKDECKGIQKDGSINRNGTYWLNTYYADDLGFRIVMSFEDYLRAESLKKF